MKFQRVLLLCAFAAFLASANAASFDVFCDFDSRGSDVCAVQLSGPIESGDAVRLDALVAKTAAGGDHRFVRWLVLDSPGGSVREAQRLAEVVRNRLLWTSNLHVLRDDLRSQAEDEAAGFVCASSCVLVLLAGANRILVSHPAANARIGLHRPYLSKAAQEGLSPGQLAKAQQDAEDLMRRYLERERMPRDLVDLMMSRASTQIYWLTRKDLRRLDSGYSSWFEELLTARCAWNKDREEQMFERMDAASGEERTRLKRAISKYLGEVQDCVNAETRSAQLAGLAGSARR